MKRACELPDDVGRSLSVWTCAELARALKDANLIENISPQSVQRILESQKLKLPWRVHHWLSLKVPRDEAFNAQVMVIRDLYTRVLEPHERVLSLDEKTSIQPRTRTTATMPARPSKVPVRLEHEYMRKGAFNLSGLPSTACGAPARSATSGDYDSQRSLSPWSQFYGTSGHVAGLATQSKTPMSWNCPFSTLKCTIRTTTFWFSSKSTGPDAPS